MASHVMDAGGSGLVRALLERGRTRDSMETRAIGEWLTQSRPLFNQDDWNELIAELCSMCDRSPATIRLWMRNAQMLFGLESPRAVAKRERIAAVEAERTRRSEEKERSVRDRRQRDRLIEERRQRIEERRRQWVGKPTIAPKSPCVYRIYNANNVLIYVGSTVAIGSRLKNHMCKHWWVEVADIKVEHFTDSQEARAAERRAIWTEEPLYNVQFALCPPALKSRSA